MSTTYSPIKKPPLSGTFLTPAGFHLDPLINLDHFSSYVEVLRPALRDLEFVLNDHRREEMAGLTPVFCLDFSEIFELIDAGRSSSTSESPAQRASPTAAILEQELQSGEARFALLPGTVFELHRFLKSTLREVGIPVSRSGFRAVPFKASLTLSSVKGISSHLQAAGLDPQQDLPPLSELRGITEALASRTGRFRWLLSLIDNHRLALLHEYDWFRRLKWSSPTYDQIIEYLSRYRSHEASNNRGDALNYTLALAASNLYETTGSVFYVLARGHLIAAAFSQCKWLRDPLAAAGFEPTSLHRDPAYLLLRHHWVEQFRANHETASRALAALLFNCRDTLAEIEGLRRYAHNDLHHATPVVDMEGVPDAVTTRVQRKARRFNKAHSRHLKSLFLAWESLRRTRRKELGAATPESLDLEHLAATAVRFAESRRKAQEVQSRVRKMSNEAQAALAEVRATRGLPVEFRSHSSDRLGHSVREASAIIRATSSTETVCEALEETVLRVDNYGDYFSMWWNASVDLHTFFDWVDYYVRFSDRVSRELDLHTRREKYRNQGFALVARGEDPSSGELHLIRNESEFIFPLDLFARSSLLALVARERAVSIRLFTPYGDVWHNFRQQLRSGARMGIISHVCLPNFLSEFVAVTSIWPLSSRSLQDSLEIHLKDYEPRPRSKRASDH